MAVQFQDVDWEETTLGDPDGWSPVLRFAVSLLWSDPRPGCLLWGQELLTIPNEPWLRSMAPGLDRAALLGRPAHVALRTQWMLHAPHVHEALQGGSGGGRAFSYIPVAQDDGRIAGVMVSGNPGATEAATSSERVSDLRPAQNAAALGLEYLQHLVASVPVVVWSADADGHIDYASPALAQLFGLEPKDSEGGGWLSMVHPDDRDRLGRAWDDSVKTGSSYEVRLRARQPDGSYRWCLSRAVPSRNNAGFITGWFGMGLDIHDQVVLEDEARRLATRLESTLNSISEGFHVLDREWRTTVMNPAAQQVFRKCLPDPERLRDMSLWDAVPELRGTSLERAYRRAMEDGEAARFDFEYPGRGKLFGIRIFPGPESLTVLFRDVTWERDRASQLREQGRVLDRARDAVLIWDLEGRIIYRNEAARRLYGQTMDEALGKDFKSLICADPEHCGELCGILPTKGEWSGELRQLREDGRELIVEARWSLMEADGTSPARIVAIHTDVTERKRLLDQFLRAQRLESIGNLASGIAHDLNNVLAPILISVQLLADEVRSAEAKELIHGVESSARRGAHLINQILRYARGHRSPPQPVDLAGVVSQIMEVVHEILPRDIRIELDIPSTLKAISGSPTELDQVLMNLITNARDAMPTGGVLRISAENVPADAVPSPDWSGSEAALGYVRLTVQDTGVGMTPAVQQQLFDPFFTTKEVGRGTGLGLFTVATIAKEYGIIIEVDSAPDEGTRFDLHFPAARTDTDAASTGMDGRVPPGRGELILVVDDNPAVRALTRKALKQNGYRVVTAQDGGDALVEWDRRRGEFDLVVTDLMMPGVGGKQLVRRLRHLGASVPVIVITGLGEEVLGDLRSEGVSDVIPKPFSIPDLLRGVRRALGIT